jgi:2-oxoglutarate ferredoxin oxidoreductase subunit alpha
MADIYRNPVMILADGMIGQMMEPIVWKEREAVALPPKDWAALGREAPGKTHFVTSLRLQSPENERFNQELTGKYQRIADKETRWEEIDCQDADLIIVAYGTTSRICQSAARKLRQEGIKVGIFRPITLWPYPYEALRKAAQQQSVKAVLTVEMSSGQMVEDVRLAMCGLKPTPFYGRTGGMIPETDDVADKVRQILQEVKP